MDTRTIEALKPTELELLRKYAHEATKAITDLAGGGSELFAGKIGDMFIADLPYCMNRVRERHDMIHRQLVGEVNKRKALEADLKDAMIQPHANEGE